VLGTISIAKVDTIYEILAKKRNWPLQGHFSRGFLAYYVTGNWECRWYSDVLRRWRSCNGDFAAFCPGYFWRLLSGDEGRVEMRSMDPLYLGVAVTSRAVRPSAAVRKCTPVSSLVMYRALFTRCLTDKHRPNALPALVLSRVWGGSLTFDDGR
jgi:hypothetical protein